MNLYINKDGKTIQGFKTIDIVNGSCDFSNIPNNACSQIIIQNALEYLENIEEFYGSAVRLIRKNGSIKIYGLDLRSLCLSYVTGELDTKAFKELTKDMKTIVSLQDWTAILQQSGLQIEKCDLKNNMYELVAIRV